MGLVWICLVVGTKCNWYNSVVSGAFMLSKHMGAGFPWSIFGRGLSLIGRANIVPWSIVFNATLSMIVG